jgi:hypothetical protein
MLLEQIMWKQKLEQVFIKQVLFNEQKLSEQTLLE